ncbi:MAG TPA: AAA family ATPase [Devosia sp.]|jgi:RecA-family ATPase|uniref:AAA family ATPase n=1 Tax=Devosia sp. TaxID=1871048 RepID=UPI002F925AA6
MSEPANDNYPASLVEFVDPSVWAGKHVPERRWYVPALIPGRTVTLLSGDGGLGKSLLALQLAIASAVGGSTMGLHPEAGRVVYVGAEDEADEFHRRIDDILASTGHTYADLKDRFLLLPLAETDATLAAPDKSGKMQATPLLDALFDRVVEYKPTLVVLDTSADLFGGDEIKRVQVRQFAAMLRGLAIEGNCAVLLLSHPSQSGMQSGSGTSGSTAWNNSVRSRLYLTKPTGDAADPDARVLTTMKANYGRTGDTLNLRWEDGVFVASDGQTMSLAGGLLNKQDEDTFLALLSKLNRHGQSCSPNRSSTYAPSVMAKHPDAKAVGKAKLESAMHRLLDDGRIKIVVDGPPSKPRSRLWVTAEDFGG